MNTSNPHKKSKIYTFILLQLFIYLVFFPAGKQIVEASTQNSVNQIVFATYKYIDPTTKMEAFRLLIPKGWKAEGSITWSANPALPAVSHFRFFNPNGHEQFEIFPTQSYFWTNNRMFLTTNPPGTYRFGTLVAQPRNLSDAFSKTILPTFRNKVQDLKITERQAVPELEKLAQGPPVTGVIASAEGGKIRVEYLQNGRQMEEEIYTAVSQFVIPMPDYFISYWYMDYIFAFKAAKGELDSQSRLFQTMAFSLQINPQWFAKVVNTKEQITQMMIQGIKAVGRMGSIIAQAGSDLRADQQSAWEQRQKAKDRLVNNFCDNIRGVQRYYDPFEEKQVELPNNYGYAWANNSGEYVVTDSPSYNPNVGSNLHWEQIKPVR